jgi:hypothetical protein
LVGVLLKIALGFFLLVVLATVAVVALCLYTTVPMTDALNALFRTIGLAGPSSGSRASGSRGTAIVDGSFVVRAGEAVADGHVVAGGEIWNATCPADLARELAHGDRVEVVYGEDLAVDVVGRAGRRHS